MAEALILRLNSRNEQGEEIVQFEMVQSCEKLKRPSSVELSLSYVSKSLICAVCDKIMQNPCTAFPCCDIFCRICLRQLLDQTPASCPSCSEPLEERIFGSRHTRQALNELRFRCENGVAFDVQQKKFVHLEGVPNSCPEVLALSDLESHTEICGFAPSVCPNREYGCPLITTKLSLESHKPNCGFRSEICRCGEKVSTAKKLEHKTTCQAEEINCSHSHLGCSSMFQRRDLKEHLEICHYEAVKSRFNELTAKNSLNEAYIWAMEKVASMTLGSSEVEVPWEEMMTHTEKEAMEKFTKSVQPELREEWGKMLVEKLKGNQYFELHKEAHLMTQKTVPLSPPSENQILFTAKEIRKITSDFSNFVASGGFGNVYLGDLYGTLVVVKKLKGGNLQDFKHELEVLTRLRHPNIALLMGFCPEDLCIVSEFLGGGNLRDRLQITEINGQKAPLSWKDRLRILREVSSALLYMHKRGIFHRDLKPANILLTESNSSKLADMGLAKYMGTLLSGIKGSFGYMDPRQADYGYTAASDVFSLGVIMLQLLLDLRDVKKVTQIRQKHQKSFMWQAGNHDELLAQLNPEAGIWDKELAGCLISLSFKCMKSLPKDRPDLEKEIIPELSRISQSFLEIEGSPTRANVFQAKFSITTGSDIEETSAVSLAPENFGTGKSESSNESESSRISSWSLQIGDSIDSVILPKPHYVPRIPLSSIITAVKESKDKRKLGIRGHKNSFQQGLGPDGTAWTICRAKSVTQNSFPDFEKEVDTLSDITHQNLVNLLGYCDTKQEQILVFEFMNGGNLKDKLAIAGDDISSNPLTFWERVEIASGVAEGLKYLHEKMEMHGNIISENIFLNVTTQGLQAKIGNFEPQKDGTIESSSTSRKIYGVNGYIDPEYYSKWKFTRKSDVYSFGVVLFELITGLPALMKNDTSIDTQKKSTMLVNWVHQRRGDFTKIVDKRLDEADSNTLEAMKDFINLAFDCTKRNARERPVIDDVCDFIHELALKGHPYI